MSLDWDAVFTYNEDDPSSITHPRVKHSHGGGMYPEQHYGVLTDGRFFYLRYRHGEASLQVLHRPDGVYDLPVVRSDWDNDLWRTHISKGSTGNGEWTGGHMWAEPHVWATVTGDDAGYFKDDAERLHVFSECLDLVDQYDREHADA